MIFNYSTRAQLNSSLRDLYVTAKGDTLGKIATYFSSRPNSELQAAFNITVGAVAALRGRMTTLINTTTAFNALVGE